MTPTTNYFVHERALCETPSVGAGTRIWAFAHVLPGAKIGADCNVCDNVFVENDVVVGDRVTIKCGVQLWDGMRIEDDVFVGPNVTFTNDMFPRSKVYPGSFPQTLVEQGASIGANATILPGIRIGQKAMVGAGAVVTRNVPAFAKVVGNPARIIGYINTTGTDLNDELRYDQPKDLSRIVSLDSHKDMRGLLNVAEFSADFPFLPSRCFIVSEVPSSHVRGEHAHKLCHQLLICVSGSVNAIVDDGRTREEYVLNSPSRGLYMPPMTWGTQYNYSSDSVLMVFASHSYDADDYIRDYGQFRSLTESN
ncbi:MAG: isomerase [Proteobacteria bacterium]|nr:MAG: isomerase [Pseudomonadota bacterium]